MIEKRLKEKVFELRQKGYSYSYIHKVTKVPKGTLSYLLSSLKYVPNSYTASVSANAKKKVGLLRKKVKEDSLLKADKYAESTIGKISGRDLLMLGIGLYMGEGTKTANVLRIVNANPQLIQLSIRWLHECIKIPKRNLRVRLHLYPDSDQKRCLSFWSETTSLPLSQFQRSFIDNRLKKTKRISTFGTCHLGVKGVGVLIVRQIYAIIGETLKKTLRD